MQVNNNTFVNNNEYRFNNNTIYNNIFVIYDIYGEEMGKSTSDIFFIDCWESDEEWSWPFEPFSKLKTTFCKYWTSIKIKIGMICVYKEYEVIIKWYIIK